MTSRPHVKTDDETLADLRHFADTHDLPVSRVYGFALERLNDRKDRQPEEIADAIKND